MTRTIVKTLAGAAASLAAAAAAAHPGHDMGSGSHWHASDAWGLGWALAAGAAVLWWSRRR